MNQIRAIQALNQKEIENGISPEASWHTDYRDTAFINFGGLPYDMSEGDVITIFSQYGEPVWLKLVRDKETGKSKGFGWLKYEDQRSTDLAVDNLGGATIGSRLVRVDHARYKFHDDEDPDEGKVDWETITRRERGTDNQTDDEEEEEDEGETRPMLPEERELALIIRDHDEDDPMKSFLIDEKKKEVEDAVRRYEKAAKRKKEKEKRKHGHRSHRSRRHDSDEDMRDADADADDRDKSRRSRRERDGTPSNRDSEREKPRERRRHDSRTRDSHRDRDERRRDRSRDRRDRKNYSEDERRRERRYERPTRRGSGGENEDRQRRRRDDDRHGDRRRSRSRSGSPRPRR